MHAHRIDVLLATPGQRGVVHPRDWTGCVAGTVLGCRCPSLGLGRSSPVAAIAAVTYARPAASSSRRRLTAAVELHPHMRMHRCRGEENE